MKTVLDKEMVDHFNKRTKEHIDSVRCNLLFLYDKKPKYFKFDDVLSRALNHDSTKLIEPEYTPYIWKTWYHKCKDTGIYFIYPDEIDAQINKAIIHHFNVNSHHPEFYESVNDMTVLDIAEMVADWQAVGQEKGNTVKSWADRTVGKRWHFNDMNTNLIYEFVDCF